MTASSNTDAEKEIEDPVEQMLKKTGCMELHYQVQVSHFINDTPILINHNYKSR